MRTLLAGACLMLFALAAVIPAKPGDFKGFYIGGNIGGAKGSSVNAQTTTVFSPTGYFAASSVPAIATSGNQNIDPGGFTGGGQAGFNFQHKSFVFGLEADYGMMDLSGQKSTTTNYPCCAPTHFTVTQFVGTDWLMTVRPRVGFTSGQSWFTALGASRLPMPITRRCLPIRSRLLTKTAANVMIRKQAGPRVSAPNSKPGNTSR